jgi:hypothetical protein
MADWKRIATHQGKMVVIAWTLDDRLSWNGFDGTFARKDSFTTYLKALRALYEEKGYMWIQDDPDGDFSLEY